jgi:pimeloyl-ACP methyl ester carboxylesterase
VKLVISEAKLAAVRAEPVLRGVVRLHDGRHLGFSERGAAGGRPVLDFHGNPGSRLSFWGEDEAIRGQDVRLIGVDRPGIGLSDPRPGRSVADWAADVEGLADGLGLERFAVMGHSVGGAYAAACALGLADRVTAAGLVSPIIPLDSPGAFDELGKPGQWLLARDRPRLMRVSIRALFLLARVAPGFARRVFGARSTPVEEAISWRPEVTARALASARESTRQGARGLVDDMRTAIRPWGFDPSRIEVPLFVWQGDQDSSIRESWGDWWAETVPGATLIRCRGEGHLLIEERIGEIVGTLASAGSE